MIPSVNHLYKSDILIIKEKGILVKMLVGYTGKCRNQMILGKRIKYIDKIIRRMYNNSETERQIRKKAEVYHDE